ncbi:hypothetical protein C6P46_003419 [Rhodotorula mucilaginosa]|uniref:Phospholipase D/nuclease n=1 Tax=Rhodotorula mucilaginosa TaxID=5537 RepID=A0A9P6W1P4_RHOMI|nr:hypothetical protein C6P46_003419 [Rhodotorula mucilaginosa]
MAPKRRADVLVLDSDDDEIAPRNAPGPRAGSSVRSTTPTGGAADADQFEQDLALAMRLSMEDAGTPSNATGSGGTSTGPAAATAAPNANSSRAELERARLERQRAREADGTAQPSVISASRAPVRRPTPRSRVATLADLPSGEDTGSGGSGASSLRAGGASSQSKLSQRFWDGAVKRVPNDYVPDDESFSFGDLIGPRQTLETAVVSAFCLDPLWVASHFPEETPLLLVMPRGPGDTLPGFAPFGVKGNTFRAVPPTRLQQGAGVMHTKLMLYIHHDFLRIVIPTANAISYDWSIIDNAFYIHDFPLLAEHAEFSADGGEELGTLNPLENPTHTQFSRSFIQVCIKLAVPQLFVSRAKLYDFSRSGDVRLVHSIQGLHPRAEYNKGGGLAALARAVDSLGFATGGHWEIEATGSSIGRYSNNWLAQMLGAASGIHPSSYFRSGNGNQIPAQIPATPPRQASRLPIKIIFPTEDEILSGRGGANGRLSRVTFLGLHKYSSGEASAHEGWMYLGSHNFTPAAWGRLENSASGPQLKITNYELGVVLPIRAKSAEELQTKADALVTYRRPLVKYGPDERPWQQERFLS